MAISAVQLLFILCVLNHLMRDSVEALSAEAPKGARLVATATTAESTTSSTATMTTHPGSKGRVPKLIVFDLDNTLWTPELYTLRHLLRSGRDPVAGRDVRLYPGAETILDRFRQEKDVQLAVASRTKSGPWAHSLLGQFGIRNLFDYCEIFSGNKVAHFRNIREQSGIDYQDMLFFDDARDGKYGNCVPVAELGVLCCHCPNGLRTTELFDKALELYAEWDQSPNTIVEWDGSMTKETAPVQPILGSSYQGQVKVVYPDKGFGFIRYGKRGNKDVFFHFNQLEEGVFVEAGDTVGFSIGKDDRTGKTRANKVRLIGPDAPFQDQDTISMQAFSMNMPFAALLANGYKDLETRNGTMFTTYPEGSKFLLHVGRRIYPDENKHIDVMKSGGLDDGEIEKLKSLPSGFDRGMLVAIVEIGKTFETTVEERSDPVMQRRIGAYGEDSGMRATEIRRVQYLKRPVKLQAKGGIFSVEIPQDVLPDGWNSNLE